jgi:hypothetical protein
MPPWAVIVGLTVAVSSSGSSASAPALLSNLGVGVAGIFVTGILIYLLAYLNVVENSERDRPSLHLLLVAANVPLSFAFAGILIYESLVVVGFL